MIYSYSLFIYVIVHNFVLYNLLDSLEFYKKVCVKSKTEIFEQCEQLWQLDN